MVPPPHRASFALLLLLAVAPSVRADVHVAPEGSDTNPGSRSRPFATLERAREAMRASRLHHSHPPAGLNVWLHGGDHVRSQTLELGPEDSGLPEAPVRWRAWPRTSPRLLGGRRVHGFGPVTDPGILARLAPAARPHVRQADLKASGIPEPAGLQSRGFSRPLVDAHAEVFHEGRPMPLARWPNEGHWGRIAGFPAASGQGDDHGGNVGAIAGGFLYEGDRPARWKSHEDAWVHGYWAWDWANSYERIEHLDVGAHLIRTAAPHGLYGFRKGQRIQFLNVLEELDAPGEWFIDRKATLLYFWPPDGTATQSPVQPETLVSAMGGPFFRLNGCSNVVVEGLVLEAGRGSGLEVRGGASNAIVKCTLRNLGGQAITLDGGIGHRVAGCTVLDTGDGGVSMSGGDRQTLAPGGHVVEDCVFARQGRWSKCYVPAILMNGVGMVARHNRITDHPHCAILYNGNDHRIAFNEIARIALETGDVGAIYAGRDYSFRGNRIEHNFIHDTGGVGMGSMGVYMDDCVSGTAVVGNVFARVHWAMFIGGGRDHLVENNVFVECDPAIRMDGRGMDPTPVWRSMVDDFMRRQLAAVPPAVYRARYPELAALDRHFGPPGGPALVGDAFKGVPPEGNVIARNVCVGKWLDVGWRADASVLRLADNYVTLERGNVGPESRGFPLPPASPAWKMGFQRIPFERIGPRPTGGKGR